ncbi:CRISPR-associated exonuclease, Cas4 family [Proteiniphilum saccharofermentans]|uniref:CRISPR-associated exonuclease Cas4 n=1 Tax=Proteiniphilum saccharofermentans TaxID=1642647 RepID=A0A1R3TAF1_9BACT|nr:CRISPR-associated protein Cas4 [Proteiniphilum saccharofermentans]SCD20574.1 CRISPR-associated exonuclease, Cas4 family [Proteiniphilum saccharofermentans]
MHINATLINLYNVCKRELWLHANGIRFEHTSDLVYDGRLIHENTYPQRSERYEELEVDGCKIDFYDARNKIIHEIKRSDKVERAHEWQVKYYMYVLEQNGIEGVTGLLEYPTLRHTAKVVITDDDRQKIKAMKQDILGIIRSDDCPPVINGRICKNCSYYEFCYVSETES